MASLPQNPPRFPVKRAASCLITPVPSSSLTSTGGTSTPTSTPTRSIPEAAPDDGHCGSRNNFDGFYKAVNATGEEQVANSFCSAGYTLTPDNDYGFVERYDASNGIAIHARQKWAKNQSRCSAKKSFAIEGESCQAALLNHFLYCVDNFGGSSTSNDDTGCLVTELHAIKA